VSNELLERRRGEPEARRRPERVAVVPLDILERRFRDVLCRDAMVDPALLRDDIFFRCELANLAQADVRAR
jgi:hypothetical protein